MKQFHSAFRDKDAWRAYAILGLGIVTLVLAIGALEQHSSGSMNHANGMHSQQH